VSGHPGLHEQATGRLALGFGLRSLVARLLRQRHRNYKEMHPLAALAPNT
jgi:hypothetical protein